MKQLQFYKYAAIGLLLLNIAMMTFFFLVKSKHAHGRGLEKGAKAILQLDDTQNDAFLKLVKKHRQKMNAFNEDQKELLKPYFDSLVDSTGSQKEVLDKVEKLERQKIESIYQHFQEIKSILRPEQLSNFEEFMNHAIKRILPGSGKKPPPPKGDS